MENKKPNHTCHLNIIIIYSKDGRTTTV